MNLPELDIEKALAGAPIVMVWGAFHTSKGFLHESRTQEDTLIFENENGAVTLHKRSDVIEKARMWEKQVVFKNWHLLNSKFTKIERTSSNKWRLWTGEGVLGKSVTEYALAEEFFPDCPVGTTLHRPGANSDTIQKPLTADELKAGDWWCADTSEECRLAFAENGLNARADDWLGDGFRHCYLSGAAIVRSHRQPFLAKQIHRIGNDFYWSEK